MVVVLAIETLMILLLLPRCHAQSLTVRVEYSYIVANLRLLQEEPIPAVRHTPQVEADCCQRQDVGIS